jgi:hypothetical protein
MALAHPLGQQCTAMSKRTGKQCQRRAIGSPVCIMHGGRAAQVRRKAEERVMVAELEAKVAADTVLVRREPEQLLLDALHDTNMVLTRIKADLSDGLVNPILLDLAGDWLDRLGRLGKIIVDGDLVERLERRIGVKAQDIGSQLNGCLAAIVEYSPLSAADKLRLWESRWDGLEAVRDGRAPMRMLGDATVRFTDELMRAAAREEALAEEFSWDDPEPESDSDAGEPLLFSANGRAR